MKNLYLSQDNARRECKRGSLIATLLLAAALALTIWATASAAPAGGETVQATAAALPSVVLNDGPGGLALVSAPTTLPLTVGHVAYLPVKVQGYHRPISVSAQTLIHTFVNDLTPDEPGDASPLVIGVLDAAQNELKLQTLRLRPHTLTLTFTAETDVLNVTLNLEPAVQPRAPLFGTHPQPYFDVLPAPFFQVWGPNCSPCPTKPGDPEGSTRDVACAKALDDSCRCHRFLLEPDPDPAAEETIRQNLTQMQLYASQFARSIGGWGEVQIAPGEPPLTSPTYLWDELDWVFGQLAPYERDVSPLYTGIMAGDYGWMTCPAYTQPGQTPGFYYADNEFLMGNYRLLVHDLTARYAPDLRFFETTNEPCYSFYLCPCLDDPDLDCDAASGPNQPVCELGHESEEFAAIYGPFLSAAANVASTAMAAANPKALLVAGALEKSRTGLTATTRHMITSGLLITGNVAIMIHQFPYTYPNWIDPPPNCSYFQNPDDPWWLPPGCETAPPLEDYTTPGGRPIQARAVWQEMDQAIDVGEILSDVIALGDDLGQDLLNQFYLFDTELHGGFHDLYAGEPHTATTPFREALAGLRIGAINAHQRFAGLEFIFAPADPAPYNLLVQHLAGATPVYAWDAPLIDADYSGLVYKLFTRDEEDILALWSNAPVASILHLSPMSEAVAFRQVTLTRFDANAAQFISAEDLAAPPATILVAPLTQFYFLSVSSDRPGFGWLDGLVSTPAYHSYLPLALKEVVE